MASPSNLQGLDDQNNIGSPKAGVTPVKQKKSHHVYVPFQNVYIQTKSTNAKIGGKKEKKQTTIIMMDDGSRIEEITPEKVPKKSTKKVIKMLKV
jgi:transposase